MESYISLVDGQQLDVKNESGVSRDVWQLFRAVTHIRRHCDSTLTPNSHAGDANIPAFNNFTFAKRELKRSALFVCYIVCQSS